MIINCAAYGQSINTLFTPIVKTHFKALFIFPTNSLLPISFPPFEIQLLPWHFSKRFDAQTPHFTSSSFTGDANPFYKHTRTHAFAHTYAKQKNVWNFPSPLLFVPRWPERNESFVSLPKISMHISCPLSQISHWKKKKRKERNRTPRPPF